jgi:cell wall-associated NlpC family hydrolase
MPSRRTLLLAFGATAAGALVAVPGARATARLHRPESSGTQAEVSLAAQTDDDRIPPPVGLDSKTGSRSATIDTKPPATDVAIAFAMAQRGATYVWGATGPNAFDCSGLTLRAYQAAGIPLPRTSREQARVGARVPVSAGVDALAPGDLVFWAYSPNNLSTVHHVALYLGGRQVVHAPQTGEVVKVSTIWPTGYAGGVRVV